jgi:prolyl-tRNA editing enzyme YbaK/EbsC (Cys-tRNA(Pro) deacylase)
VTPAASPAALRVQAALGERFQVLEFDASTRTAADAAAAIGCTVAEIAKSLMFRGAVSNRPVLVVASGACRVDETKVAAAVDDRPRRRRFRARGDGLLDRRRAAGRPQDAADYLDR